MARRVIPVAKTDSWATEEALTQKGLALAHAQLVMELLADHAPPCIELVGSHVGDLQQHGGYQVDALEQLQVDVHVEGHLPALLDLLLLLVALLHAAHQQPLPQQLLGPPARLDVQQGIVGVLDHALPEGADAQLHHRPVVQNLPRQKEELQGRGLRCAFLTAPSAFCSHWLPCKGQKGQKQWQGTTADGSVKLRLPDHPGGELLRLLETQAAWQALCRGTPAPPPALLAPLLPPDLHWRVCMLDVVLQVTHEHQVPGLVPAVVQGMVVNVAEDGTGTDPVCPVLGVDELAEPLHQHRGVLGFVFSLVLL